MPSSHRPRYAPADCVALTLLFMKLLGIGASFLDGQYPEDPLLYELSSMGIYVIRLSLPLLLALLLSRHPARTHAGEDRIGKGDLFGLLLVVLGICLSANTLSSLLLQKLPAVFSGADTASPDFGTGLTFYVQLFSWTLLPAILEELLFRGYILSMLLSYGSRSAVLLSALLFALSHNTIAQIIPAFVAGLCLGWLRMLSHNVGLGILTHFLYNSLAVVFVLYGGTGTISLGLLALSLLLLLFNLRRWRLPDVAPATAQGPFESRLLLVCIFMLIASNVLSLVV